MDRRVEEFAFTLERSRILDELHRIFTLVWREEKLEEVSACLCVL